MTDSRSELSALADELRKTLNKSGKEWSYWPLIDRAEKALRLAASQPDREAVARIISEQCLGHDFNSLYADKREWLDDRGSRHDVNVPYKSDVLEAADAILLLLVEGDQKKLTADGQHQTEQSGKQLSPATDPELLALIERAKSHVMSPAERYEQRRSFVRGMCPSSRDYAEWCAQVDKIIPPMVAETDAVAPGAGGGV